MFKSLIFFARFFLFWLIFFAVDRLIFIIIFYKKLAELSFSEKTATFYHALRLDFSMTAYLAVIPLFFFSFYYFSGKKIFNLKLITIYNKLLIIVFTILSVVNFNIYREWSSKINARAISFAINSPGEAFASSASSPILLSIILLAVMIGFGLYLNFALIKKQISFVATPLLIKIFIILLLFSVNFLLIRGGLGTSPNTQSMGYFSKSQVLNHASLNTEWNLMSSILASRKTDQNPYLYFEENVADEVVRNQYKVPEDTSISILKNKKPNIVIFILESFTADLTKTLGDEDGITPNFDSLINKGVLFTNIYAAGNRTDKGLIATLTGFPTLATGSIVKWPEKMQKLPAISQSLFNNGYQTSFFYGGESEFDNYKAFILSHSYQKLIDKNNFDRKDINSKWGAYDGLVFQQQLSEANSTKQPFFSTILSLTNHEPFEVPGKSKFGISDNIQKFKSTAYYTDSCINAYLKNAQQQDWYKNTLFIFVADHGHLLPKNKYDVFEPQRYHIPLLLFGDVIKSEFIGKKFEKVGSQQDIPSTLLSQLNLPTKEFVWSKNLLNPYTKPFAFFSWDNGLGFVNDNHCVTFDNIGKNILYNSSVKEISKTNENLKLGKSYLQSVYQQFIKL